jgi:uncharacterized protein
MKRLSDAERLRIYISESDKHGSRPLYEAIIEAARAHHLAGATVLRGLMGFGAKSHIHTAKVLCLSENLPVLIEIIDQPNKLAQFMPVLDGLIGDGLVTVEKVKAFAYIVDNQTNPAEKTDCKPESTG